MLEDGTRVGLYPLRDVGLPMIVEFDLFRYGIQQADFGKEALIVQAEG